MSEEEPVPEYFIDIVPNLIAGGVFYSENRYVIMYAPGMCALLYTVPYSLPNSMWLCTYMSFIRRHHE